MYYIIYCLLYLFSLLPFAGLYFISDGLYALTYYIIGYRKKIVLDNIKIAFPQKTEKEQIRIAKQFYKNLIDTFIEMVKMISISEKAFAKRCKASIEATNALAATGKNIQLMSGHQMNWEYMNWAVAREINVAWVGVYLPLGNKALDKIFVDVRARYKTVLVSAYDFKSKMHNVFKSQHSLGLAADQSAHTPSAALWLNFFGKPAPFVPGPEKGAMRNNAAIVFIKMTKIKRGYYHLEDKVITENAADLPSGRLTNLFRDFLEDTITNEPSNYLWSHRRWKFDYQPEYKKRWIDEKTTAPVTVSN